MRRKKYRKRNKYPKAILLIVSIVLSIVGIITFTVISSKESTRNIAPTADYTDSYFKKLSWDGNRSIYIVLLSLEGNIVSPGMAKYVGVVSIDPVDNTSNLLTIPPNLQVSFNGRYMQIGAIYALGNVQSSTEGMRNLVNVLEDNLGLPISGYIIVPDENLQGVIKSTGIKSIKGIAGITSQQEQKLLSYSYTNLDLSSITKIVKFLNTLGYTNINQYYIDKTEEDNNMILDASLYDEFLSKQLADLQETNEFARIEVYNATNISGLGAKYGREVSNSGGNVIRINNLDKNFDQNTIYVPSGKYNQTAYNLSLLLGKNLKIINSPPDFFHTGDIQVIIGSK